MPATRQLIAALADDDIRVVWYSIYALGSIGPQAAPAVPTLRQALTADASDTEATSISSEARGNQFTRRFAAQALKALPKPRILGPAHPFEDDDKWR